MSSQRQSRATRERPIVAFAIMCALQACTGHDPAPTVFAQDCQVCHIPDYVAAQDPVHVDVYPERCVACHNNITWRPEDNSGHDWIFPVAGTQHADLECADCHPAPAETLDFTCTECHAHLQPDMDREHRGNGDYVYESRRCLDCHPDGGE